MAFSEIYRNQVALLIRILPLIATGRLSPFEIAQAAGQAAQVFLAALFLQA
jgi:hypothetical protein